jgi:hypothetical protein
VLNVWQACNYQQCERPEDGEDLRDRLGSDEHYHRCTSIRIWTVRVSCGYFMSLMDSADPTVQL